MKPKEKIPKELLEVLYFTENKTFAEMGRMFGRDAAAICYWFKKYNIPTKKKNIVEQDLRYLYCQRELNISEIALILDCSGTAVNKALTRFNISRELEREKQRYKTVLRQGKGGAPKGRLSTFKGRRHTDESKEKISQARLGKSSWCAGLSKATHPHLVKWGMVGSKHWAWKGGVSSLNSRIRQTPTYKKWRQAVFERDNWTCCHCCHRGGKIEAHHIKEFAVHQELRFDIQNGMTLCIKCHRKLHQGEKGNVHTLKESN